MSPGFDLGTVMALASVLAVAGAVTGVLAGLFGVGGGAITVPLLFFCFSYLGIPESIAMPLAVGSSLAVIIPTSIMSARGHMKKDAVDLSLVKAWGAAIVMGVIAGAVIARFASAWVFQLVFVVVASANAVKLLFGKSHWRLAEALPKGVGLQAYGLLIGVSSALMGIGGGAISNLVMTLHQVPIHRAVATSAMLGVLISVPGAIGYVFAGWGKDGLPPGSIGFVSLIAFALMVPTTLLTTGYGVSLAHRLSKRKLEIAFGCFLALVSARFVLRMLGIF